MGYRYTPEQKAFIERNVAGIGNKELTERFNAHFGLELGVNQIKAFKHNHRFSSGLDGRFDKNHSPWNKGKKGVVTGGVETQFKKGQRPLNYKPVGSERIDRDGYVLIKVSDEGAWHERWMHKHKVIWEREHGPIPPGHVVLFADGNTQNLTSENLILITKAQLVRLNQNHLISDNPELTKTGIIIADLYQKIGERKKSARVR
ncbi:HNH endonuclease [Bacillus canaveralius]|uniref:HNH endonuclease n=1 Tax=Bacillus canaveralius TaxID=1403243 RepID=A0A2N5GPK8_9BACI|nr:HNH endonuclease signature motif containing protein [Bacillus canaveralius]PLR84641.1 HNH endonuclease [Bacillus canaveralius]PLS00793.1 HNH endonuclease [Bacillus canaveralius]